MVLCGCKELHFLSFWFFKFLYYRVFRVIGNILGPFLLNGNRKFRPFLLDGKSKKKTIPKKVLHTIFPKKPFLLDGERFWKPFLLDIFCRPFLLDGIPVIAWVKLYKVFRKNTALFNSQQHKSTFLTESKPHFYRIFRCTVCICGLTLNFISHTVNRNDYSGAVSPNKKTNLIIFMKSQKRHFGWTKSSNSHFFVRVFNMHFAVSIKVIFYKK